MPGAGSVTAANYVYGVAKPDGLTVGMVANGIYLDQLVGRKEVQFDVRRFGYLGSPSRRPGDSRYRGVRPPHDCATKGAGGQVVLLRAAYEKALKDPELLAEAKKGNMDVDFTSGEDLEKLTNQTLDQPPDVLERVKKILR